jgi:hypothetical protein
VRSVISAAQHYAIPDIASDELQRAQDELDNRAIVQAFEDAMDVGAASGSIGQVDVTTVDTAALDRAITMAMDLGCVTTLAVDLLQAAKLVRRLRSVLKSGNWEWVGEVLAEAREVKEKLPEASLREFQLAQDELDNRSILSHVASALATGGPRGAVGELDLRQLSTDDIDNAVEFATRLGCKTVEASQIVATAKLVRKLRQSLADYDLPTARALLESVKGKVLSAAAAEEIQLVKYEVDNWLTISELIAAIGEGAATGGVGAINTTTIDTGSLDVAISLTMKLGCHTGEARRALLSALLVRRLRAGLLESDWEFVRQVLSEAEEEAESVLPGARSELQLARDELRYRNVMHDLGRGVRQQDEDMLVDALARGTALGLPQHSDANIRARMEEGTLALGRIQRCKAALQAAVDAVSLAQLSDAVALAASMNYETPLVNRTRELRDRVAAVTASTRDALVRVDRPAMLAAQHECASLGLRIPELDDIGEMLRLDEESFLRKELAAAVALNDVDRVVGTTMRLKDRFFEEQAARAEAAPASAAAHRFELHQYPNLKPAHMFSRKYGIADSVAHTTMLQHTTEPIHTSLTRIDNAALRRVAIKLFRNLMAFMGDRPIAKPMALVAESLSTGLTHEGIRDEIFMQVCKQINGTPTANALDRAWVMMELALNTFPPSEDLENYLEKFLREKHAQPCVVALHTRLYLGPGASAPTAEDVEEALRKAQVPAPPAPEHSRGAQSPAAAGATPPRATASTPASAPSYAPPPPPGAGSSDSKRAGAGPAGGHATPSAPALGPGFTGSPRSKADAIGGVTMPSRGAAIDGLRRQSMDPYRASAASKLLHGRR